LVKAESNPKTLTGVISDSTVYTLTGHQPELDQLAGQTVTETGKLSGSTSTIESVTKVKK